MTEAERSRLSTTTEARTQASPNSTDDITVDSVLGMTSERAHLLGIDIPWVLLVRGHPELIEEYWQDRFDEELSSNFDEAREWISSQCGSSDKLRAVFHLHSEMEFSEMAYSSWCVLV